VLDNLFVIEIVFNLRWQKYNLLANPYYTHSLIHATNSIKGPLYWMFPLVS